MDIEKQKEHFKNHIATFSDYGNIKIIDFANPESCHYRIRFIFEEDFYRLHISGDLGELIATNYRNMCYKDFAEDFVHDIDYFRRKVVCHNRPFYIFDYVKAREELTKRFEDYECIFPCDPETEEAYKEENIDLILEDFNCETGLGSMAFFRLSDIDKDCFEWIGEIGRVETDILELYMLAFELAQEQLKKQSEEEQDAKS